MAILVTGCAGFLGSHLAQHHLDVGEVVYGIDNFSSSKRDSKHFQKLLDHENFYFVEGDITDRHEVMALFEDGVDETNAIFNRVYNFACPASPPIYQRIPVETLLTCTQGFNNIIQFARVNNPKVVIVHASTSEVYGDPDVHPQPEWYRGYVNSYGPRSNYDEGKRAAEALAFDYLNKHGVDIRLVRIFNTYGPHMDMDDGRVVSNFVKQILAGSDITVYGSGKQTRSFCYVDDLIAGIVSLGDLPENPKTPINIGNPTEFTIYQLALEVMRLVPETKTEIVFSDAPVDDPLQRRPDITFAYEILGYEPKVSLTQGLTKMLEWARNL